MEVIRLSGYTELEKAEIAKRFLVKKQMEQNGLTDKHIQFTDAGVTDLIQHYTREAGVRNLEREIGNVCRKVTRKIVSAEGSKEKKPELPVVITAEKLKDMLGPAKFRDRPAGKLPEVGAAVGLAWTEVGGEILTTEATLMEGKGKLTVTGKLGDVMQESAQAAMSYIRFTGAPVRPAAGFLPQFGHPPAHSGGSHSEGWSFRRHHHGDHDLQRLD